MVSARKVAPLQEVAARHAGALALPLDAYAPGALVAAMPQVLAHLGRLDLAMYCAGHYAPMRADRLDLDEALRHQDVNVGGAWRLLDAGAAGAAGAARRACQPGAAWPAIAACRAAWPTGRPRRR